MITGLTLLELLNTPTLLELVELLCEAAIDEDDALLLELELELRDTLPTLDALELDDELLEGCELEEDDVLLEELCSLLFSGCSVTDDAEEVLEELCIGGAFFCSKYAKIKSRSCSQVFCSEFHFRLYLFSKFP